jgi:hypothetical protein
MQPALQHVEGGVRDSVRLEIERELAGHRKGASDLARNSGNAGA